MEINDEDIKMLLTWFKEAWAWINDNANEAPKDWWPLRQRLIDALGEDPNPWFTMFTAYEREHDVPSS